MNGPTIRIVRALAAVVVLLLAGTACATPPPPAPVVAELVWAAGGISAERADRDVAKAWNVSHPAGPHVRVDALPQSADDQRRLLELELGAGIPDIDIFDLDVVSTAEFASRGWLTDLEDVRADIEAGSLPAPVRSATWQDRLWAAPYTTDAGLLYYRTDLVSRPPTTWAELIAMGRQAVAGHPEMAPYVFDGAASEGLVVSYLELLWGAGGEFTVDGADVRLDGPAATTAMTFLRDGYTTGLFAPGTGSKLLEDARNTFKTGHAVFMRSWPYAYNSLNGGDPASMIVGHVGIAPLPTFTGTGTVAALGGTNLAVSRFSHASEAAKEFVRFASTDPGVQRMLAEKWSLPPVATSVYADVHDNPVLTTLSQVLPQARTRPATAAWAEMSQEAQQQIVAGTLGRARPADAVATLARLITASAGAP